MLKYYYRGTINAAALKPALLDPVYEILLVRVISVVDNEGPEASGGLALDPVLEDEAEDAAGHLQQQQDGEEDRVGSQQGRILPQRPDTANKCCNLSHILQRLFNWFRVSPMTKVMAPPQMKIKAGSKAMFVSLDRLLKVSFSVQAQIPIARTPRPRSCNSNNFPIKFFT